MVEYDSPWASIRITRARRILGSDLETAHAALELGSFIGRQRQRHMAPDSTSTASVSTSH
jgi:hypothetical protein